MPAVLRVGLREVKELHCGWIALQLVPARVTAYATGEIRNSRCIGQITLV